MRATPLIASALMLAGCQAQPGVAARDAAPSAEQLPTAQRLARVPLTIETAKGARRFTVEVAETGEEQARGLMFRTALAADEGMIFPMWPPRPASFWMKNTPLPLDIIFIRADGTIARIAENTVPYSLDLVDSGEPVAAVLEIVGGGAAAAGIREGDRVRWSAAPR